ncbi:MAG: hypothetical protein IKA26_08790 [Alistipes sp.]|nr:hypothetical protein [Rikenellaceae bacterium]MBR1963028.1 hypothetical protein [Alistipes sp.]
MRKTILFFLLFVTLSAWADERGEKRLERIARHYSAMGNYVVSFELLADGGNQKGVLAVNGNNSYVKIADSEVFVVDSVRYEVRSSAKEIVVDRADAYEKELFDPLKGFAHISKDFEVEECEVEGRVAVRLSPKRSGDVVHIVTAPDGESISKIIYGSGGALVEVQVRNTQKSTEPLPHFSKESYKGFELIDFR